MPLPFFDGGSMKMIFLVRHAEPLRLKNEPDSLWPLTAQGHQLAEALRSIAVRRVYSSPYRRALETAQHVAIQVIEDIRLRERTPGEAAPDMGDCWLRQYAEPDFKCPGGESFAEVGQRMAECIGDVLAGLDEGDSALVVSHAAAICAFLMRHGSIVVTDRASKMREITWRDSVIYAGNLPYLTGFCLTYQQGKLLFIEVVK